MRVALRATLGDFRKLGDEATAALDCREGRIGSSLSRNDQYRLRHSKKNSG
jgi:hypothetical protein